MFDETVTVSEQPMVTILETGPRYDLASILAAFPTAVSLASALPPASADTEQPNPDDARELSRKAVAYYQEHEPDLWAGRWQDYSDPLTGEKPFPSQSEADHSFCRRIGYWGRERGVPCAELTVFVETVFSQSALADRDKWRQRKDYRVRTIARACEGLNSLVLTETGKIIAAMTPPKPGSKRPPRKDDNQWFTNWLNNGLKRLKSSETLKCNVDDLTKWLNRCPLGK
jgi:hypothetical protein